MTNTSDANSPSKSTSADTVADAKAALRTRMRTIVESISEEEIQRMSAAISRRLTGAGFFDVASTVMLYLPLPREVDLTCVALRCFQDGKTVCVPRVDWNERRMTAVEILGFEDEFEVRRHGVREPVNGRPVALDEIDLIVVPGLAFDTAGRRVGRGGGFYDRFLSQPLVRSCRAKVCGVCFDSQIIDAAPVEPHDARVDVVATDRRLICTPCRHGA